MKINPDDTSDDVWRICKELWQQYEIHSGGLKNFGGAGRILWIDNGRVVDYDWCMAFMNDGDSESTQTLLKTRTDKAFK